MCGVNMKFLLNVRVLNSILLLLSVIGTVYVFFLQYRLNLEPCPLCIFQRIGLWVMGIFALLSILFSPKNWSKWLLWLGGVLATLWAFAVAGRHVWLQHLPPDEVPACGPGLNYWVDTLPMLQVLQEVLKGSGECAVIDWTLFGFSIPEQSLIFFALLTIIQCLIAWRLINPVVPE